jgi:hypothetical protein
VPEVDGDLWLIKGSHPTSIFKEVLDFLSLKIIRDQTRSLHNGVYQIEQRVDEKRESEKHPGRPKEGTGRA